MSGPPAAVVAVSRPSPRSRRAPRLRQQLAWTALVHAGLLGVVVVLAWHAGRRAPPEKALGQPVVWMSPGAFRVAALAPAAPPAGDQTPGTMMAEETSDSPPVAPLPAAPPATRPPPVENLAGPGEPKPRPAVPTTPKPSRAKPQKPSSAPRRTTPPPVAAKLKPARAVAPAKPKPSPLPAAAASPTPAGRPRAPATVVTRRNPGAATSADELAASVAKGGSGSQGRDAGGGGGSPGEADWYKGMIYERFHAQWEQPTSVYESVRKYTATLRIRIEKDGRISSFHLVKSSGLVPMDESVLAAAARVGKIDPPPAALVRGGVAEINIGFVRD